MKKRRLILTLAIISCGLGLLVFGSNAVFADTSSIDTIKKKWNFAQLYQCLRSNDLATTIDNNQGKSDPVSEKMFTSSNINNNARLPSYGLFGVTANAVSCREVLTGYGSVPGVYSYGGVDANLRMDSPASTNFLEKVGYQEATSTTYNLILTANRHTVRTTTILVHTETSESDSSSDAKNIEVTRGADGRLTYAKASGLQIGNDVKVSITNNSDGTQSLQVKITKPALALGSDYTSPAIPLSSSNLSQTINSINSTLSTSSATWEYTEVTPVSSTYNKVTTSFAASQDGSGIASTSSSELQYPTGSSQRNTAAINAVKTFGGYNSIQDLTLSEDEQYEIYSYYVKQNINMSNPDAMNCSDDIQGLTEVHLKDVNGEWRKYYVAFNADVNMSAQDLVVPRAGAKFAKVSLNWIVKELNKHETVDFGSDDCIRSDITNGTDADTSNADACTGGSPKLGWILCPIINGLQAVLESVYEGVVEPLLQVDVSAFDTSSGIYGTWQVFQNMANIVFVIMFLITIFSQITGFGIDNFGVKRLLPKIIIAAILVNLSYIICQLLVDVSNIAGVSLKGLFDSIEVNGVRGTGVGSAIATFASGGALATTAAVAGGTAEFWLPALLLPFLLGLIGVLIGLIFMLILLGVRQAGVIILVILSPVAFVMYMLPNTKPVFDKWKKYFTSLLLLFPICSAMIGGCGLAGRIIGATADGFWMALLGALLSVVPFFLIPGMVKSTMGGLGAIGSMLTNAQGRISGGIQGAARFGISNSNMMKNLQGRQQERLRERERGRLQSTVNRISRTPENARTDRQKRQLALAQTQLNKMTQEDAEAAVGQRKLDFNQARTAAESRRLNAEIDAIKTQNVNSGLAGKVGDLENDNDEFKGMDEEGKYASLADALYDTDFSKDDNKAMTYALVDQLMASGHHGEQALYQILQKKGKAGDAQAVRSIAGAMKLNNNFGGLKTASRLTYDYVNDVANGSIAAGATMGANEVIGNRLGKSGDVKGVNFGNMTQEALVGANVEELTRYADAFQAGRLNEEQAEQLKKLAVAAKGNERLASRRKGKVDTQLDRIIDGTSAAGSGAMVEGQAVDTRGREAAVENSSGGGAAQTVEAGGAAGRTVADVQESRRAEQEVQQKRTDNMINVNGGGSADNQNSRFANRTNEELLDAATRPGVDESFSVRAQQELDRRENASRNNAQNNSGVNNSGANNPQQ